MLGIPLLLKSLGINTIWGSLHQLVSRGFSSEGHFAFHRSYLLLDENRKVGFSYEDIEEDCISIGRIMSSSCKGFLDKDETERDILLFISFLLQQYFLDIKFRLISSKHSYRRELYRSFICCFYPCVAEIFFHPSFVFERDTSFFRKYFRKIKEIFFEEQTKTPLRRQYFIIGRFDKVEENLSKGLYAIREYRHPVLVSSPVCKSLNRSFPNLQNTERSKIINKIIENNTRLYGTNSIDRILSSFISTCVEQSGGKVFFTFSAPLGIGHNCYYSPIMGYPADRYAKLQVRNMFGLLV